MDAGCAPNVDQTCQPKPNTERALKKQASLSAVSIRDSEAYFAFSGTRRTGGDARTGA